MAKIIYLPVPPQEAREMAAKWNQGRTDKKKQPYRIIECRFTGARKAWKHMRNNGDLGAVGAGNHIIIILHGLKPAIHVNDQSYPAVAVGMSRGAVKKPGFPKTTWEGGTQKSYSPTDLAEHLDKEGLTHTISGVTLFCCSAGATRPNDVNASFAQRFKQAMVQRGFHAALTVHGYSGDLAISYNNRRRVDPYPEIANPNLKGYTRDEHKGVYDPALDDYVPAKARKVTF